MDDERKDAENKTLRDECPGLARAIEHADKIREGRTAFFLKETDSLQGLDNFLTFLAAMRDWFQTHDDLKTIAILLGWLEADFYTAIDATLRGFHSVAFDAMRDEMEIEILLSEFAAEPDQMEKWVRCGHKDRKKEFGHVKLRVRKAARLGISVQDLPDDHDYRGHSLFLHVNPAQNPFGGRGIAKEAVEFGADACFWDIYLHARNLVKTLMELRHGFGPSRGIDKIRLPAVEKFTQEFQETMRMQNRFMPKLKAMIHGNEAEGEE